VLHALDLSSQFKLNRTAELHETLRIIQLGLVGCCYGQRFTWPSWKGIL